MRNALFWIVTVLLFILLSPFAYLVRSSRERVHRIQKFWSRLALRAGGVKVDFRGLEHIQPGGSYMIMSNHQSYMDIFVLLLFPVFIHWMAKKELFKIPLFGVMLRIMGGISIDRGEHAKGFTSIKQAARTIQDGKTVLIFPEGTRSPDGELLPFTEGGFFLAILSRAKVLPVIIKGTHAIMPKGSFHVSPGTVHVTVKEPIETKGRSLKERDALQEEVRAVFLKAFTEEKN